MVPARMRERDLVDPVRERDADACDTCLEFAPKQLSPTSR